MFVALTTHMNSLSYLRNGSDSVRESPGWKGLVPLLLYTIELEFLFRFFFYMCRAVNLFSPNMTAGLGHTIIKRLHTDRSIMNQEIMILNCVYSTMNGI